MTRSGSKALLAGALSALALSAVTAAHAAPALPAVHKSGSVEYLSGGVGRDEAQAIGEATAAGPFLLAKLPAGRYSVDATLAGKTMHERVVVKAGHPAKAVFLWPAGTGESHVGQAHS